MMRRSATEPFLPTQHYRWITNEPKTDTLCAAVLATVLLTPHVQAADNLHFYGNLLSKSCTLVVRGETLAEVDFPHHQP